MMLPAALQVQMLLLHSAFVGQTLPHAPQFCTLVRKFAQIPLHNVAPVGHTHLPAAQDVPPVQARPQLPQLLLLVCRFTHAPLQTVCPDGQAHAAMAQS